MTEKKFINLGPQIAEATGHDLVGERRRALEAARKAVSGDE